MLQPRKRKFTLKITPKGLLLCVIILLTFTLNLDYVKGEDERNGSIKEKIRRGERVIRHGDVNIVVLDDLDRRKLTPSLGLLSTTARTFIQEGTTTEYATHIYGTTVGDKYAHIVSTGSKIFFDNVRPTKEKFDPIITFPSLDSLIFPSEENIIIIPTKVAKEKHVSSEKPVLPNKEDVLYKNIDSLKANIPSISEKTPVTVNKSTSSEEKKSNFISIKKEISIKPAKVKLKNELPTFTITHDSAEIETKVEESFSSQNDNSLRSAKNVPHKLVAKMPELTTTTYFGFADFVTTAGNTVIIFTPKTQKPNEGAVTSVVGEPTLSGNVPLSTAIYRLPTTTNAPVTTESEEVVTEAKEYETTTLREVKSDDEQRDVVTSAEVAETTTESLGEVTTESVISSTDVDDLVKNNLDVPFIDNSDSLESSFAHDINPTSPTDVYKTLTYLTTFYLSSKNGQIGTSIRSNTVVVPRSTEEVTTEVTTQSGTTEMEEDTTTESDDDVTTVESITEKVAIKKPDVYVKDEQEGTTDKPVSISEESKTDKPVESLNKPQEPKTDKPVESKNKPQELKTDKPVELKNKPQEAKTDKPVESKNKLQEPKTDKSHDPITTTPEPNDDNVEVELIFKTLYTTYTYLTTYFEKSSTKVKSREEVVTNVVTSTLDNAFLLLATDPAVAGLFSNPVQGSYREAKVLPSSVGVGRPTASFDAHRNEIASSNVDLDNEITKPTPTLESHRARSSVKTKYTTYTSFSTMVKDDKTVVMNNTEVYTNFINPSLPALAKSTGSVAAQANFKEKILSKPVVLKHTPANSYKMTIKRIRPTSTELTNDVQETKKEAKNDTGKLGDSIVSEEMAFNSVIISAPLTNDVSLISTKKSTEQTPKKVYLDNDNDDDQLSQESNTEETHPNPSLISLQTSYTTYTYFTTLYKGTTSEVVSRLETVTNVNTELIKPSSTEAVQTEEATAPVTYYTTYTYWTTFYKDGSTMIKSRQETVSNVAQPTPTPTKTRELKTEIVPTKEPFAEPVTYYTTFTYFTTSYIGNSSVVNSHLETVTNVVDATKAGDLLDERIFESSTDRPIFQPTGLISTAIQTQVNDNLTTVFSTNTYGTYVDGVYSKVLESTSSIVTSPIQPSTPPQDLKPTGLVSVNEGKIIDAFNITTTLYTTKVIGTYIENFYAQLIESTSTVNVNTEKLSNLVNPSTVILHDRIYQTGVLQLTEGSIVKDKTTTFYQTKVVGNVINDQYSSVTETSSSVFVEIVPTKTSDIKATATADLSAAPPSSLASTSPSPAVIESSLNENSNENDNDDDKDKNSRRKSFTPVIRPFVSRSRPTFLPKKKTSESLNAATITRGITPTIVAIPAVKTSEARFGSANRNRFASSRKSSAANTPSSEVRSAIPSSRRFSKGKSSASGYASSSSSQFSKTSSAKSYTPSSAVPNYKRGSYRPTSTRSVDYLSSTPTPGSRFRIRPTASGRIAGFTPSTTPKLEEIESSESAFTEQALSSSDEEVVETLPPTTTESSRRSNPLLRFRKPAATRNTTPSSTTVRSTTPRKNSARKVNSDNKITTPKTTTTTKTSRPKTPSSINNRLRPKPANSLFPTKPPYKKTELESEEEDNGENEQNQDQLDSSEETTESQEAVNANSIIERSTRRSPPVSIKPFPNRRGRVKRQSEWGYKYENTRSQGSRYRRPTQNSFPDYLYYDDVEYTTEDVAVRSVGNRNAYKSRNTQQVQQPQQYQQSYQQPLQYQQTYQSTTPAQIYQSPKIRASTAVAGNSRAQFTLREKTPTTTAAPQRTNRRTTTSSYRKFTESVTKRSSSRRGYTTTTESSLFRNNRKQTTSRRTTSRSRYKDNDFNANAYSPAFDGTITVTHKIPTEVTIPVFNGKVTEYKNVVTAKASLQTLAPHQYSTITGKNGATTLQLVNEVTEALLNGGTEITRFIIQEFPTTSVTFTPTTIRGRKTSFSHVIPSTVYEIKPEISTIQPQLNANAPLANLLLSQLLLGNLGIQNTINPLLGLNQASATPVTEFKTKTTSYVTTITHSTSTIIPVTFRGKEIKTTVIDSSTQVITATEYITETVVISPTQTAPSNNQLNTLLLPALLQAQLLNQPQPSTTSAPIDENIADNLQVIQDAPSPSKVVKNGLNVDNEKDEDYIQKDTRKKQKGKPFDSPIEPAETSVVTLYLSGRRPGEFSTVLSTVTLDEKSATLRKRNADDSFDLKPSALPSLASSFDYDDYFDEIIKSGINDIPASEADQETQSLESIIGDFGKRLPTQKQSQDQTEKNHFLLKTSTESAPFRWNSNLTRSSRPKRQANVQMNENSIDDWPKVNLGRKLLSVMEDDDDAFPLEDVSSLNATFQISADNKSASVEDEGRGRYNLATKVMSNGVEVIVALDKSTLPGSPQLLRVLPTSNIRPVTLTPSTVTDHMIMMLPHGLQDDANPLVTKTYVTTYTYLTTFLQEGETTTSSKEKVVSNVLTENINVIPTTSPNADAHVVLSSSPILATKVLQTTYTMQSTVSDGDIPHVVTSQQTLANTITAPGAEYAQHLLQPSEPSYVESNSITSKEPANEDYTIKPTEKLNSELHLKISDKNTIEVKPTSLQAADVTKTYFVTYTYFSTLLENGTTVVKSNIATSSDVVTEKVYMPLKRTKHPSVKETLTSISSTDAEKPISIFATKTYLTTFTYFTTLLQDKGSKSPQTVIRSRTKVMQNLVTETLNTNLLNSDYLSNLKHSLKKESLPITATATLNDGQKLEITAVNENNNVQTNTIDRISSSIEESQDYYNQVDTNPNPPVKEVAKPSGTNSKKEANFTTIVLHSSTVMKNGATLFPGSQVIKFTDNAGNVSVIPVSDPVSKHPEGSHKPDSSKIQMNNLLSFGSLGINSLSALKPVINAMAGLWQNNIKSNVKDKTEVYRKPERPYVDKNPLMELNTNLKPPNRMPIYIPVGSANDNEEAESQDVPEQYSDVNQRNNHNHITFHKPAMEKPLMSGGIPISPGQVITANTDVIVGSPAVHGPRPPFKNVNDKSDVPIGMKPPPLSVSHYADDDREKAPSFNEMLKIPPKPLSPAFLNNGFPTNFKFPPKNHYKFNDQKIPLSSEIRFSQLPPNSPLPQRDQVKEQTALIPPHPVHVEHSSLNPLLVNVRPSQVAQVVIPHGSQTALIYSDEPSTYSTKGEIFNDPSPYPEANVNPGFVGLKVYGPVSSSQEGTSKLASNTIHLDIPIDPYASDGALTESHHFIVLGSDGKPQAPYNVVNSVMKGPQNESDFSIFKRPNSKYNFTTQSNVEFIKRPTRPTWQHSDMNYHQGTEQKQRPFILPQNKPLPEGNHYQAARPDQNESNLVVSEGENEASELEDSDSSEDDEITQETKLKPSSNAHSNEFNAASATISVSGNDQTKESGEEALHDYEINQNWEIMREKPQSNDKAKPTQVPARGDNSTTRENPNIKYSEWTSMEFPTFGNDVNVTIQPHLDSNSIANLEKENGSHLNKKPASHNRNNQDDVVIGLSPPPLPRPSSPPQKTTRPSLKPYEPKVPQRPSVKNKPKPTNPPYPFEKPTPTSVTNRPKTTISKPPPNILYETEGPNFAEEILKMKPLNTTGRIEPVKKWQTTAKPTGLHPVFGNVVKVADPEKVNEEKHTKNTNYSDPIGSQSDTKVVVVDKPAKEKDKTTELISKWGENGVISSSKNDIEDAEYKNTPTLITTNRTKASNVGNTIFGNLYTRPPPANIVIIPTHSTTQHYTAISMVIDQDPAEHNTRPSHDTPAKPDIKPTSASADVHTERDVAEKKEEAHESKSTAVPTYYITHTKTLSVTITQTTVVQRDGQPSTHTVVLTKTQTSTLIDTVTKIQTLLQPTSVLSTVTTTVPVTVSKESPHTVTPSEYPIITGNTQAEDDSIFVVMTDKKSGTAHIAPAPTDARPTSFEVQVPDEANEISPNDILYSGIFTQHNDNECRPECKITKNEICQKVDSTMRCVCRPGFARMFPDHPCKPTYTYVMRLPLDRQGEEEIHYTDGLADRTSPSHQQLTEATRDGLDRMVMQSNLRDIYHGIVVSGFEPAKQSDKASVVYMVQLSENAEEIKLLEEVHKTLKANNYSLGGTDVFAAPDMFHFTQAEDFDECSDNKYHDCSEHAHCFNLRGTYTCSCEEGYTDMSYNTQFPGRVCSADAIGCELCNYHGTCYYKANEDPTCECFQWYAGELCQINLKVTLISLIAIGVLLSILLVVCVVMTCNKQKPPEILRTAPKPHVGFRRYRSVSNVPGDKRAIVSVDTSSEGSIERTPPPFIKQRVLRNEPPNAPSSHGGGGTVQSTEQRDRSLTVLIPRAKYRPVSSQPSSTLLTMSTFGPEQKLLNYAGSRESSRTPEKKMSRCSMHSRRLSNSTNLSAEPQPRKKMSAPRRPSSGALVSAGFEVSATVRRTQELDEAYISQSHNDLNQPTYNSIRTAESSIIVDVPALPVFESSLEDFITRVDKLGTVSEARSYDETTIQPPMRSLHHVFHSQMHTCGSKNSSSQKTNLDEHHTMGERDLGSTYMPKSQLYKPDHRESDGSNFDSL